MTELPDRNLLRATLRLALPLMVVSNFVALVLLLVVIGQWELLAASPGYFLILLLLSLLGALGIFIGARGLKPDWHSIRLAMILGPLTGGVIGLVVTLMRERDLVPLVLGICAGYSYGIVAGVLIGFVSRDLADFSRRGIVRYTLVFIVAVILHLPYTAMGEIEAQIEQQYGYGVEFFFEWGWFALTLLIIWAASKLVKRLLPVQSPQPSL